MSRDRELQEAVLAALTFEPSVTAAHIGVAASAGVMTLTGHVEHYWQKRSAEKTVARVPGVNAVVEALEVRLPMAMKRSDEDIARVALNQLACSSAVPHDSVGLVVEEGRVTLTGEVDWPFQKRAAAKTVLGLIGVVGIVDRVTPKPYANPSLIIAEIDAALHRSRDEPGTIALTAVGGRVTLTGTVKTTAERNLAGATASDSLGTSSVENELAVFSEQRCVVFSPAWTHVLANDHRRIGTIRLVAVHGHRIGAEEQVTPANTGAGRSSARRTRSHPTTRVRRAQIATQRPEASNQLVGAIGDISRAAMPAAVTPREDKHVGVPLRQESIGRSPRSDRRCTEGARTPSPAPARSPDDCPGSPSTRWS